ncbi:MAG: quinone-dependent dihydroorotate dehydrogenase [Cytophagales bacterium]|nr:quinone-dependent dihydroorotate dehydrogenase [Cytophagales bacterium]
MIYRVFLRPLLFLIPAERAHNLVLGTLRLLLRLCPWIAFLCRNRLNLKPSYFWGLSFRNRLGLAAGFDKDGRGLEIWDALGFGFVELGTVTPRPQLGNPRPRLFRLPEDRGLWNSMGFNNRGVVALRDRLRKWRHNSTELIIGVNLGKNKDTPLNRAFEDYLYGFNVLFDEADYFVINISSPNTPGLRDLQEKEALFKLLDPLIKANHARDSAKPILLKISPDMSREMMDDVIEIGKRVGIQGFSVHNTTLEWTGLKTAQRILYNWGQGGISGPILRERATRWLRYIRSRVPQEWVLIGVGGIDSAESALERLAAGADLLQLYTGLIYEGPGLIRRILKGLPYGYKV